MMPDYPMGIPHRVRAPRRRTASGLMLALLLCGVPAAFFIIHGTHSLLRQTHETATATATVVEAGTCNDDGTDIAAQADFTASNGNDYTVSVDCDLQVGQHAVIKYDPANPTHSNDSRFVGYVCYAVAAAMLLLLWGVIVSPPDTSKQDPAEPDPAVHQLETPLD